MQYHVFEDPPIMVKELNAPCREAPWCHAVPPIIIHTALWSIFYIVDLDLGPLFLQNFNVFAG